MSTLLLAAVVVTGLGSVVAQNGLDLQDIDIFQTCPLGNSTCGFSEDAEELCQRFDAGGSGGTCSRTYSEISMEYVIIYYCSPECEYERTEGSIHHNTWINGDEHTVWYNNYVAGFDLDAANADNTNNDCGEWHDKKGSIDESDEMVGSISQDRSSCETGAPDGYWGVGVDQDGD